MSLMKRFRDLTVATLNDQLKHSNDPLRVIDGFLAEMQEAIRETETLYRQSSAHSSTLRTQYVTALTMAEKREAQALTALKAGEEGIARAVLAEKVLEEEKRDGYKSLYEQSAVAVKELEEQLAQLKRDYQEAYHKRQFYAARLETLRLQQRMQEQSRNYAWHGGAWFHRLEERITDLEHETRALIDVRTSGADNHSYTSMRKTDQVEEALEALKRKLKGSEDAK